MKGLFLQSQRVRYSHEVPPGKIKKVNARPYQSMILSLLKRHFMLALLFAFVKRPALFFARAFFLVFLKG